jgi:transcriptional regulator with XRE-family HTH domain
MAYDAGEFGEAVRRARREKGLTQTQLAERLGVSRTTVSRLEAGGTVAMDTALGALSECGYAVAVVPKFSDLRIGDIHAG